MQWCNVRANNDWSRQWLIARVRVCAETHNANKISKKLTHLVLVREVVGIKGLRREKPPDESNRQTGI